MAADIFLKIDGVNGESVDEKHAKWIEVESVSFGVSNPTTGHYGGGMGHGKATFQDVHFSKVNDIASSSLWHDCATGRHISKVDVEARKQGGTGMPYLTLKMEECVISSYSNGAGGHGGTDSFAISYSKIWYNAIQQNEKGAKVADNPKGYDLKVNKKL